MQYNFETQLFNDDSSTLMWHWQIPVPEDIMIHFMQTDKRIICHLNTLKPFHAALMPSGEKGYFIIVNNERRKKLKLNATQTVKVTIELDKSEYGMEVPEIFYAICEEDPEGNEIFHQLSKGKQRTLLHTLGKVKSESKQLEKWLTLFDYLKRVNGELDFKELNEAYKNSRFKL